MLAACLALGSAIVSGAAQRTAPTDVSLLLSRLGDAVLAYYGRAQSIMWDESLTQQAISRDMRSDATPARRLLYELRLSFEPTTDGTKPEANVLRTLVRVNNRAPREKDKPACLDPRAETQDSLSMFLPENQREFVFSPAGNGKVDGRQALMIDYRPRDAGKPGISWKDGKDDCLSWDIAGRYKGRVWVDPETADVLRLEYHLAGMIDFDIPKHPKRYEQMERITVERLDTTIKFRRVAFSNPDESLVLPASQESVTVVRSSSFASNRITQDFKNYRRFMTDIRIVQ